MNRRVRTNTIVELSVCDVADIIAALNLIAHADTSDVHDMLCQRYQSAAAYLNDALGDPRGPARLKKLADRIVIASIE